ncbi:hypothetical protein [Actinoplanes sp. HUAS TT8]
MPLRESTLVTAAVQDVRDLLAPHAAAVTVHLSTPADPVQEF